MNPKIAKNLKISDLTGPEAMVGTFGFIARSRYALGYRRSSFIFNKDALAQWRNECQDDCVLSFDNAKDDLNT